METGGGELVSGPVGLRGLGQTQGRDFFSRGKQWEEQTPERHGALGLEKRSVHSRRMRKEDTHITMEYY